jgi:hypothetical protein
MFLRVSRKTYFLIGVLGCLFGMTGCSTKPERAYQSWSSAVKAGNFPGIWECLTPQARGTVLQIMVLDADLLSDANPAAKDAFGHVFSKYGLNPQDPAFAQNRLQVATSGEYAADLNNVFRQFGNDLQKLEGSRYHKLNAIWTATAQASLGASQRQGTRATAAVQGKIPYTPDNASVQAVFEKVNGRWLLAELEESVGGTAVADGAGMPAGAAMSPAGMPGGPQGPGLSNGATGSNPAAMGPGGQQIAMAAGAAGAPGAPGSVPAIADSSAMAAIPGGAPAGAPAPAGAAPAGVDPKMMAAMAATSGGVPAGAPAPAGAVPAGVDPKVMAAMAATSGGAPAGAPVPAGAAPAGADVKVMAKNFAPGGGNEAAMAAAPNAGAGAAAGAAANGGGNQPAANAGGGPQRPGGDASGNNQNRPKPGSWEHAVLTFVEKVAAGDYSTLDYVVSSRAKGLLAEIRNGELSPERIDELKASFDSAAPQPETFKNTGAAIVITMKGKLGHAIVLTVGKEDGVFKVRDLKISEPGATKKR